MTMLLMRKAMTLMVLGHCAVVTDDSSVMDKRVINASNVDETSNDGKEVVGRRRRLGMFEIGK